MLSPARIVCAIVVACLLVPCAHGSVIVTADPASPPDIPGVDPTDLQMSVDLSVLDGVATMTFTNTSVASAGRAVIKEIVVDGYDDDTATALLTDPVVVTDTPDVAYKVRRSNGLPGYRKETSDPTPLVELRARSPKPVKGIGVGEALVVSFQTSLPDGATIHDYLAAFNGGDDSAAYSLGFHAIRAGGVGARTASRVVLPEPAALAALTAGAAVVLLKRKRR
ncbi:MAG: PEP-CTERM sorting domain-containing protein [Planctomycetota bacterium]|jgi:hypothetical protein